MKTLDKTPRPIRSSPLRFELASAPDRPQAPAKEQKRRGSAGNAALKLRKRAQKNATYEKLTAQAQTGLLSISDALSAPHLFNGLKGKLASNSKILQLDQSGKLMRATDIKTFLKRQSLQTKATKMAVGELLIENSKVAAHLLFDAIGQWSPRGAGDAASSKPRADLQSIFHLLMHSRGKFLGALGRESSKIPNLMAAASRINVALVFLPALEAPILVRKTTPAEPKKEISTQLKSFASLSLLPRRQKKAQTLTE